MTDHLRPAEDHLVEAMARAARGPRRNGFFALWLLVRAAAGRLPPDAVGERAHGRRLDQLERRLSSLSLPGGLKRACGEAARGLRETGDEVGGVLQQLGSAARDGLGAEAGEALTVAARAARMVKG